MGVISDVGQYFPLENRETLLGDLTTCLAAHLEWHREARNKLLEPEKYIDFTVCHNLSSLRKTAFVTDGFAHISCTSGRNISPTSTCTSGSTHSQHVY